MKSAHYRVLAGSLLLLLPTTQSCNLLTAGAVGFGAYKVGKNNGLSDAEAVAVALPFAYIGWKIGEEFERRRDASIEEQAEAKRAAEEFQAKEANKRKVEEAKSKALAAKEGEKKRRVVLAVPVSKPPRQQSEVDPDVVEAEPLEVEAAEANSSDEALSPVEDVSSDDAPSADEEMIEVIFVDPDTGDVVDDNVYEIPPPEDGLQTTDGYLVVYAE